MHKFSRFMIAVLLTITPLFALEVTVSPGELKHKNLNKQFFAEGRFGGGRGAKSYQLYLTDDKANANKAETGSFSWESGVSVPFSLEFDGAETVTFSVGSSIVSYKTKSSLADLNDMYIRAAVAQKKSSTRSIHMNDLILDGTHVNTDLSADEHGQVNVMHIGGSILSDGFSLEGNVTFTWSGKHNPNHTDLQFQIIVGDGDFLFIKSKVWKDQNSNGKVDDNEDALSNVIVNIYQNSTLVASDTTDHSGQIMVGYLEQGTYAVKVEQSTIPSGMTLTTESNPMQVTVTESGFGDINFGFSDNPVAITLSSFQAEIVSDHIEITWVTEMEVNHAGFNLYRSTTKEGPYTKLNSSLIIQDNFSTLGSKTYHFADYPAESGTYFYKLEDLDLSGISNWTQPISVSFDVTTTRVSVDDQTPNTFSLTQNYPNPFNPATTIEYELPHAENVALVVFNVRGMTIQTLVDEYQTAGEYSVTFDGRDANGNELPSGTYFYSIQSGDFQSTRSMTLIK